jgi:tetratricopeptide (TPR) repeat protein
VFPEVQIDGLDGYDEIYRKLNQELMPTWPLSSLRARILGFSIADDKGKATQIASLFDQLVESREAIFIRDGGGLLDNDGALQQPLRQIFSRIRGRSHPTLVFVAERMIPHSRRGDLSIAYCALPSMTDAQVRQLAGFLLTDAKITYSNDDLEQIVSLSDGHPFNVKFLVETAMQYTLPVALADTSELTQWKRKRGSEFLRKIEFMDEEKVILAALHDFSKLDFATIQGIVGGEIAVVGKALARLMDFHVIEAAGDDTYQAAPPLRIAIDRDKRLALRPDQRRAMLKVVSDSLQAYADDNEISVSMIDAGILATLQEGNDVSPLFSAFLLPSHLVWLAKRHYDRRRWPECARLTLVALENMNRLSPAGKVEACRLLCLSSARMDRQDDFKKGIAMLRTWAGDSWARSNVHFLLGFNARLDGNLPQAEVHLREAYKESPGNFSAIRELAATCMIRGQLDQAETFARQAIETASDNPYILDILLSVLIACPRNKLHEREPEIAHLFQKLESVGEEEGRSFYTTRRAEYEFKHGSILEACRLIDSAALKTPGIFDVHALRAKIYLERGIKTVASDEIEKMRRAVYHESAGERRTNLRPFLEIEASYLASCGDYKAAKEIYGKREVFTEEEAQVEIRNIDYEQALRRQ